MSDPQQNSNVEDVLSSIRRLVSEQKRKDAPVDREPVNDRLVLTPALRVSEQSVPHAGDDLPKSLDGTDADAPPPRLSADSEAAPAQADAEDEPLEEDDLAPPFIASDRMPFSRFTDRASVQPRVSLSADDDRPQVFDASSADVQFDDADDLIDALADDVPEEKRPVDASVAPFSPFQTLTAKIAALEEIISRQSDEWEPDDAGADAQAGVDDGEIAQEDAKEPAPDTDAAQPGDSDTVADRYEPDDGVLDEDALRDLVADVVREELQGALGERITRNVRKLVRREIHRALAAQDLD